MELTKIKEVEVEVKMNKETIDLLAIKDTKIVKAIKAGNYKKNFFYIFTKQQRDAAIKAGREEKITNKQTPTEGTVIAKFFDDITKPIENDESSEIIKIVRVAIAKDEKFLKIVVQKKSLNTDKTTIDNNFFLIVLSLENTIFDLVGKISKINEEIPSIIFDV